MIARRIVTLAAASVLAVVAVLADCGGAVAQQVVRFLHNETDPPSIKFFQDAIREFEAANPGIRIEMEAVGTDARLQKLTAALSARTAPELIKILPEERFDFVRKGYLEPLDDVYARIGKDDFVAGSVVPVDGKVYDLPYTIGNWGILWYREDLLKAANQKVPTTWGELLAVARALTRDTNNDGKPDEFGIVIPAGKNRMTSLWFTMLLWQAGGTYFDKDLNLVFDGPAAHRALAYARELAQYAPPGIASYSYNDIVDVYMARKAALAIFAPRLVARVAQNVPDLLPVTRGAPLPMGQASNTKLVATNSFSVTSTRVGSKAPGAARRFLEFILTGKRAVAFALTAPPHLIPPLRSIQRSPELLQGDALLRSRPDVVKISFDTSNGLDFDREAGARFEAGLVKPAGLINPYMGAIVARHIPASVVQKVLLEGMSPEAAARWGHEEMRKLVDELKRR